MEAGISLGKSAIISVIFILLIAIGVSAYLLVNHDDNNSVSPICTTYNGAVKKQCADDLLYM